MIVHNKNIEYGDAILNCIPIVSTINNAAQAIYKLAHEVLPTNSPVVPGWKTDLKIHVLNKTFNHYFIYSIPIIGNVFGFINLMCTAGDVSPALRAIWDENEEVVDLILGSTRLTEADAPLLSFSLLRSKKILQKIINAHHWHPRTLFKVLSESKGLENEENINAILDYCENNQEAINNDLWFSGMHQHIAEALKKYLKYDRINTVDRIIQILPPKMPLSLISPLLLNEKLPEEQRQALIRKIDPPSMKELSEFLYQRTEQNTQKIDAICEKLFELHASEFDEMEIAESIFKQYDYSKNQPRSLPHLNAYNVLIHHLNNLCDSKQKILILIELVQHHSRWVHCHPSLVSMQNLLREVIADWNQKSELTSEVKELYDFVQSSALREAWLRAHKRRVIMIESLVMPRQSETETISSDLTPFQKGILAVLEEAFPHLKQQASA